MGATTLVNLFTHCHHREPWTKALIANPQSGLSEILPGLSVVIGDYQAMRPVVARPIDLYMTEEYRRDGVVSMGNAFQVSCPTRVIGIAMVRLPTDIEQLASIHVPQRTASTSVGAAETTAFYDDPVKLACDAKALHDSEYR